ncbi:uncharacterized protein VTP21DRAFT_10875 [Calcarisporiella thermophila]|uniref:uncharacterized protein n=1 Tax=Calcarisporiella thermophila TaxID=911321 RepID=UPI003742A343
MIVGIGVDMLHIPRLQALLSRRPTNPKLFARRILSPAEQEEPWQNDPVSFLSSRWTVKEACYKALYPSHRLNWKEVTLYKVNGKPQLRIENAKKLGISRAHVSISHDGEYVIAQVVFEGNG